MVDIIWIGSFSTDKCYDRFDDCADLIGEDPDFCEKNEDGQAHRGCRKSCNKCAIALPEGTAFVCFSLVLIRLIQQI